MKRRRRRILGLLGLVGLLGVGIFIGGFLAAHAAGGRVERRIVWEHSPMIREEVVVERMERPYAIEHAPTAVPPLQFEMPEIPEIPEMPEVTIVTERPDVRWGPDRFDVGPSPLEIFRTVSNSLIGLGLIIVGLLWLRRERREPVEKQPEADVSG